MIIPLSTSHHLPPGSSTGRTLGVLMWTVCGLIMVPVALVTAWAVASGSTVSLVVAIVLWCYGPVAVVPVRAVLGRISSEIDDDRAPGAGEQVATVLPFPLVSTKAG